MWPFWGWLTYQSSSKAWARAGGEPHAVERAAAQAPQGWRSTRSRPHPRHPGTEGSEDEGRSERLISSLHVLADIRVDLPMFKV